jgi:hypothetical protein
METHYYAVPKKKLALNKKTFSAYKTLSVGTDADAELNILTAFAQEDGRLLPLSAFYLFKTFEAALEFQNGSGCLNNLALGPTYGSPIGRIEMANTKIPLTLTKVSLKVSNPSIQNEVATSEGSEGDQSGKIAAYAAESTAVIGYRLRCCELSSVVWQKPFDKEEAAKDKDKIKYGTFQKKYETYLAIWHRHHTTIDALGLSHAVAAVLETYSGSNVYEVKKLKEFIQNHKNHPRISDILLKEFRKREALAEKFTRKQKGQLGINLDGQYFAIVRFCRYALAHSLCLLYGVEYSQALIGQAEQEVEGILKSRKDQNQALLYPTLTTGTGRFLLAHDQFLSQIDLLKIEAKFEKMRQEWQKLWDSHLSQGIFPAIVSVLSSYSHLSPGTHQKAKIKTCLEKIEEISKTDSKEKEVDFTKFLLDEYKNAEENLRPFDNKKTDNNKINFQGHYFQMLRFLLELLSARRAKKVVETNFEQNLAVEETVFKVLDNFKEHEFLESDFETKNISIPWLLMKAEDLQVEEGLKRLNENRTSIDYLFENAKRIAFTTLAKLVVINTKQKLASPSLHKSGYPKAFITSTANGWSDKAKAAAPHSSAAAASAPNPSALDELITEEENGATLR